MQFKVSKFLILIFVFIFLLGLVPVRTLAANDSSLLISKIKTGPGTDEYVEVFNPGAESLDTSQDNLRIEYLSAAHDGSTDPTRNIYVFQNEIIDPQSFFVIKHSAYDIADADENFNVNASSGSLAKTGGSIRIINDNGLVDIVGWGSAAQYETNTADSDEMYPLSRCFATEIGPMVDTDNNLEDLLQYESLSLRSVPLCPMLADPEPDPSEEDEGGMGAGSDDSNSCSGLIITEVFPNPSGSDGGKEFIELHNPTSTTISLEGCMLQTTANNNIYIFGNIDINPKQYKAFYDNLTGLTLENSAGGSVYLVNAGGTEDLYEIEYLPDMDDDTAWAINSSISRWFATYKPTPGEKNEIVEIKPCPKGQFRNLETNRCNKIAVEASLSPCPPGKFRNPASNRCKSLLSVSAQLKPCNAGQFRNPETNRCKSLSSNSSLVPCKADQERNPQTNRCRKKASGNTADGDNIQDVLSASQAENQISWLVAGFSFAGASVYAVWEWRNEMLEKLLALKNKLGLR